MDGGGSEDGEKYKWAKEPVLYENHCFTKSSAKICHQGGLMNIRYSLLFGQNSLPIQVPVRA